jgi:pyruvate kinase
MRVSPPEFILTKILATVGPACASPGMLAKLIDAGARVFRINFSHGTLDEHARMLAAIREAADLTGVPAGVLGDLSGPKIRVGRVIDGGVILTAGERIAFCPQPIVATPPVNGEPAVFSTTQPEIIRDTQPGQRLLLDDGNIRTVVVQKIAADGAERLICEVQDGGLVTSSKGINLPDTRLSLPSVTARDWECVDWAIAHGIDFLAQSFVRRADDVRALKAGLAERLARFGRERAPMPVVAKIEKPEAIAELDGIVALSDSVMVARGDLGVEMDLTEVPVIQKRIIRLAHDYGKPAIVATQMLQSMIDSPTPTRAEVSDVANAIFDGADAVMLSGETAVGKHPLEAVRVMGRVALTTQRHLLLDQLPPRKLQESRYRTAALAHGVSVVVRDLGAKLVVTWSERGGSARYLSQNRLAVPIVTASSDREALRRMSMLYGVAPIWMERPANGEEFVCRVEEVVVKDGWARQGDTIVVVRGEPIGTPGVTNELLIHYVGDVCRLD